MVLPEKSVKEGKEKVGRELERLGDGEKGSKRIGGAAARGGFR